MKRRMPVSKRQPLKVVVDGIEDPDKKVALLEYWLDRLRYQIVVTGKVVVVLVVSIVSGIFPLPCVVIAVGINHLAADGTILGGSRKASP